VGIAYELTPKTVVRTSYGIFFDTFGKHYAQTQQGNRGNWPFAFPSSNGADRTYRLLFSESLPGPGQESRLMAGQQCLNVWSDFQDSLRAAVTFSLSARLRQHCLVRLLFRFA